MIVKTADLVFLMTFTVLIVNVVLAVMSIAVSAAIITHIITTSLY